MIPAIFSSIQPLGGSVCRVLDVFSGTSRVGHALKKAGYQVTANDYNAFAYTLARCYVQSDARRVLHQAQLLLPELQRLRGQAGYFTETFCVRSRFFQPKNGERIDAIRETVASKGLEPDLEAVVLTSLMEAADRVDSTVGLQMAYLKTWAARAHNDLELRLPDVLPGAGRALLGDALDSVKQVDADLVYLDPPYNQHSYRGNYHIWESLVRWDKPEVYGVACKRIDCQTVKSPFNSKRTARAALAAVIDAISAPYVLLSFNDQGFLTPADLKSMLAARGEVTTLSFDFKRYVGAQIGIYNPAGEKVGKAGARRNHEFLFLLNQRARLAA